MKRLETFLTSPCQADPTWQPLGRTVCWLKNPIPFSTAAELHETWSPEVPVSTRTVCQILSRNGLHGRISAQKPALNKRQLKNRQPAKRMDAGKVAEGGFLRCIFCWITSQSPQILQETYLSPHGSEIHQENSQVMVWGYIQYGGVREICRVEGNINSLKYQEVLAASYIPNHKRGQILQQDGAPSHTSISTSKFKTFVLPKSDLSAFIKW